ncbi:YigZ family protein [Pusillimonas sp. SM2304]|uniref:IMPACT family protein n=1 Tax=Pusillimonas sp. SM2304 TaxID=3073241 RepID=UPI0028771416|nr:YigZ family protein [Pusillimonas sp. SM2304]MDS1141430.1 YigZ family protein [Pusillimonas sp. SM2304]
MSTSTLTGLATYQEDIKKSRFIAMAGRVDEPAQALAFFAEHSVADATHNCWAYRIQDEYRFNDDGEPGGTAGRPILQAIDGQQCDRVAVLVIRWFGGIKLGPGGLIRAYGGVAAQCLRLADKAELVDEVWVDCACSFADMAIVQSRFAAFGARICDESFDGQGVRWRLALPRVNEQALAEQLGNLTRGQGQWRPVDGRLP